MPRLFDLFRGAVLEAERRVGCRRDGQLANRGESGNDGLCRRLRFVHITFIFERKSKFLSEST